MESRKRMAPNNLSQNPCPFKVQRIYEENSRISLEDWENIILEDFYIINFYGELVPDYIKIREEKDHIIDTITLMRWNYSRLGQYIEDLSNIVMFMGTIKD